MRNFHKISFEQFKKDIIDDYELYQGYVMPERKTQAAAGYDFIAISDFEIKPGEIKKIPTGIKAEMNYDEMLMILVRSSMGFKYNVRLCNQVGIVDADYYNNPSNEGHIWLALQNEGKETYTVKKGEAFGQGIFTKYLTCGEEVENKRVRWSGEPTKEELK